MNAILKEALFIDSSTNITLRLINELESLEKDNSNLPLIFSEILKDEINANDEIKLYNGIKRIIKKYSQEKGNIAAIQEFVRVLCGGASIDEILQVTKEEVINPTVSTELTTDSECEIDNLYRS